jgi:succinate-semialdehyde dehydrogenase/glutarate-semialdehyde dehydrogenase
MSACAEPASLKNDRQPEHRPASAPTASWFVTASITPSPSGWPRSPGRKVADGFEPGAVIGPLIDMKAVEKVEAHIADALKKGAKVVTGGKRAAQGGSFFEPTVPTDVTTDMVITKEETFGPVAPLYRFKTDAEAIKMANEAPTLTLPARGPLAGEGWEGFAPYFYSRDIEALEYGIVGINEGIISIEIAPFRRHEGKRHRPHLAVHWGSKYGIEEYLEVKYLCLGGINR